MGCIVSLSRGNLVKIAFASVLAISMVASSAIAADSTAIVGALRLSGIVTGGTMPTNSPEFTTMVNQVSNNDYYGAAQTAVQSQYAAGYLLRRLAFQMQNAGYVAATSSDDDATAYLIAHFAGVGGVGSPTISKIWSDDVTCMVNVVRGGNSTNVHAADLTPAEINTIDWRSALTCSAGQQAVDATDTSDTPATITIPQKHVGGYPTLSDRKNDNSFAQLGATAGTNLRYIENIWMVATGMDLLAFASTEGRVQNVPRFVPENDPHFLIGNGQTACIACHAGGIAAINHGYSTLADLFDVTDKGFTYNDRNANSAINQNSGSRKSLGSMGGNRGKTLSCNLGSFTVCNPDSVGEMPNQGWELASTWGARGMLTTLGWNAPTSGQGLNALGQAIGKAGIVYSNMVKRVIREVCPLGAIPNSDVAAITTAVQTSDNIKTMIAQVASNQACR